VDTAQDCPSLGVLRAHLDHDDPTVARHLDGCDACRGTIVSVAGAAGTTRRLLATLDEDVDAAVAPAVTVAPAMAAVGRRPDEERAHRGHRPRRRLAAVGAAAAVVVLGGTVGQPVVAQVLDSFRTEQVRPVTVDPGTIASELRALEDLADVTEITSETLSGDLADLEAAAALAGVTAPDLTAVADVPDLRVEATGPIGARIVFDTTDEVPERLRGVTVEIVSPGALVVGGQSSELIVARARSPEVTAIGASLDDARDALLSEVELPPSLRDQLAAIDDWRTALPVPVPVDTSLWDEVEVGGTTGLAIGAGGFAIVVWQDEEVVQAVAARGSVDDVLAIAVDL
jgi:hypothetical protein